MKKNVASQVIGAQMVTAADGTAFTGSVTAYVTGDGGTQAVGSVGSGACTHEGNGFHTYAPAQEETNYDHVAFTFTGAGAIPVTIQAYTNFPQTGDSFARLGAPAGDSVSADIANISTTDGRITSGTAQAVTSTSIQLASGETFANDEIVGSVVVITGGSTGVGQSRIISDYVGSTDTATISPAWTTTPTGTITYAVYPAPPAPTDSAVLPTVLLSPGTGTGQVSLSSGAVTVGTNNDKTGYGLATGAITAAVIATDAIDADAIAADAVTEIQSGLATAANLATVDTVVDGIKAKTDSLTFTVAGQVDANIQSINDVTITGNGQSGTEFGV